jgi:hypothetical protein
MSMMVIVTFDLHKAKPKSYGQVKRALGKLKLKKQMHITSKDYLVDLPANTFAAKFKGKWEKTEASELRDFIKGKVREVILSLGLHATVFVSVGGGWAWSRSNVIPRNRKSSNKNRNN